MSNAAHADVDLVTLGSEDFPLVPQPIGTLSRRLQRYGAPIAAAVATGEVEADSLTSLDAFLSGGKRKVYDLLLIFYPSMNRGDEPRMPFWRFDGWSSEAAMKADLDEDEGSDGGPTLPQIRHAILAALEANELHTLKELRDAVPFDSVKAAVRTVIRVKVSEAAERAAGAAPSPPLSIAS